MRDLNNHYEKLSLQCDYDNALIATVIKTMSSTFPEHISIIDKAFINWDTQTLKATLHLMKGSLSYLSLDIESQKMHALESYITTNNKDKFKEEYPEIRSFMLLLPKALYEKHTNEV